MHIKYVIVSLALSTKAVGSGETQAGNLKHIRSEGSWNICSIQNSCIHSTYYSVPTIIQCSEMTKIKQFFTSKS